MSASELQGEVAHLRALVVTLEVRLELTVRSLRGAERRMFACDKCAGLEEEMEALRAVAERLCNLDGELRRRLIKVNDEAFSKAWVARHAAEVALLPLPKPKRAPRKEKP